MEKLSSLRLEIQEVDQKLIDLFKRRFGLVQSIATYKYEHQMDVFDPKREDVILASLKGQCDSVEEEKMLLEIYQTILKTSKEYQEKIIEEEENHG